MRGRIAARLVAAAVGVAVVAGCTGSAHDSATQIGGVASTTQPNPSTPAPVLGASPGSGVEINGSTDGQPVRLTAKQVADPGFASQVGAGRLSAATVKRLLQYLEDRVASAYAHGRPNELEHYLAGPMLSGNRATILLLNSKQRHNVFRIKVDSVHLIANQAHRVVFTMTGDMQLDYFYSTTTHKVLDHGLPGPSRVKFLVFLDENPKTHTWYWTGEKSDANGNADALQGNQ